MHSWVTIAVPFDARRSNEVRNVLRTMGNPANEDLRSALRSSLSIHFVSAGVIERPGERQAHLLVEASSDLSASNTVELLASALSEWLIPAFSAAGLRDIPSIIMSRHIIRTGQGLLSTPGLNFTGTPGMTVKRIRDEWALAREIRDLIDAKNHFGLGPRDTEPNQTSHFRQSRCRVALAVARPATRSSP